MRYIYLLVFLLSSMQIHAQDISGKWEGNYGFSFGITNPQKLVLDFDISSDSIVRGMSHLYHKNGKYEHYYISGKFRKADSTIVVREDSAYDVHVGLLSINVLGTYSMKLKYTDSSVRFEGKWKENTMFLPSTSKVWLERPLPKQAGNQSVSAHDSKLDRVVNVQKLIEIDEAEKDSIKIMLVDNGQVDGDVITLYLNDSVLLSNQRITGKSLIQYISVGKDMALCKLLMVAENEGEIPPCTAHLTVITRKKTYQLDLFSNAGTNGAIQFFLKE